MNPGKILCVDDEESVLITIQAVLEEDGHEVHIAQQTDEGLALLRAQPFDLVLTDLRIDERDRLDILRAVKAIDEEIVVIMLTGYASLQSAIQALRSGAYDYLVKPCDVNELKLTIERGIERRRLAGALRERVVELEAANTRIASFAGELEEKVEAATAELAAKVEEVEHANAELARLYAIEQQQTAHLQQLNDHKSSFLSMVAHELRTPLTGLRGFTDLMRMRQTPQDARQARIMTLVTQQVERLSDLVNELLSMTNIEQQGLVLRKTPLDLAGCIDNVIERFEFTYPMRRIVYRREVDACDGVWDCERLEQVVSNLIANAIKYSAMESPITVTLHWQPASDEGTRWVRLSVADEGIGIPADEQARLFEKFYRASNAEAYGSGLGLGLFISGQIVRGHGGRIEVESEEGKGSTFSVVLPIAQGEQAELAQAESSTSAPG